MRTKAEFKIPRMRYEAEFKDVSKDAYKGSMEANSEGLGQRVRLR